MKKMQCRKMIAAMIALLLIFSATTAYADNVGGSNIGTEEFADIIRQTLRD